MTEIDYGPLSGLIGEWNGSSGTDIAPEPDGKETNPYYETITFEAGGDVTNAESQTMAVVPYRQVVQRKSDDKVFHHQVGYWLWDAQATTVIQSVSIPRAVCCLAGGSYDATTDASPIILEVSAKLGAADWGIIQSPFMRDNAVTEAFTHKITLSGDELRYAETMFLNIYGKKFEHTDENVLQRVR